MKNDPTAQYRSLIEAVDSVITAHTRYELKKQRDSYRMLAKTIRQLTKVVNKVDPIRAEDYSLVN